MRLLDRIRAKISPTNQPSEQPRPNLEGNTVTEIQPEEQKEPTFKMPFSIGEYFPMKGLLLKVDGVSDEKKEMTLRVVGITHARARKLGLA